MHINISLIIINYQKTNFLIPLLNYLAKAASNWDLCLIEILVIDNFSSESEILKQIVSEKKLNNLDIKTTFLFLDKNYGPSYSRNRGVEIAQGEYIQFLDVDDWIAPHKIPIQYQFAVENSYPSFVTSKWSRVTAESSWDTRKEISIHQPYFSEPIPLSLIKNDGFVPVMAGLIKKDSWHKSGGFREEMWLVEDVRFLIDLYQVESSFAVCPSEQPLFFYRVGQSHSLSNSRNYEFCNACYSNAVYVENLLQNSDRILSESDRQVLLEAYGNLARFYFERDRPKFYEVMARIHNLNPNYLPSAPKALRQLTKWFGYEQAEAIALTYRRIKQLLSK
ncbi:glycosyltransferase family 2 protein [Nostoc sp. C117]|uniref:glycosyltransferase family 2 protein n=1 Tax=Nostoc sp. C117 TaxID=3349875 RepID=UPI00370CFF29